MKPLLFFLLTLLPVHMQAEDLQLTLPPVVHAVSGVPLSIYDDNIVLTQTPEAYRFEYRCAVGKKEPRCWSMLPGDAEIGTHPLEVIVRDTAGTELARASTNLSVSRRDAGQGKALRMLILGDSLTHATLYPNELARWLSTPGNPAWSMIGTHIPASAKPGVAHEGYGGWKWADFLTKYTPQPPGITAGPLAKKSTSPFIYPDAAQKPVFDLTRYFKEHASGHPPDVVTFLLGINDCFGAAPDSPDAKITEVLTQAEKLLAAFRQAAPQAVLAVGLTTPPNSRQVAFEANYKDKYTRWGWKRIQHRLVRRMLERLGSREAQNIHLVPTELYLDPVDGYPVNNGVHPNATGYAQIGTSFYCWLKSRYQ